MSVLRTFLNAIRKPDILEPSTTTGSDGATSENEEFERLEECQSLSKQATQLKATDINAAVVCMEKATQLCPGIEAFEFKLSRYLCLAKRRDDAFKVLRKFQSEINRKEIFSCHFRDCAVAGEMAKHVWEEKRFDYYIYYSLEELWSEILGLSVQGRFEGFGGGDFKLGRNTKIDKACRFLNLDLTVIETKLSSFLAKYENQLIKLSELAKTLEYPTEEEAGIGICDGTVAQRWSAALFKSSAFREIYDSINGPILNKFWKSEVEILLKAS